MHQIDCFGYRLDHLPTQQMVLLSSPQELCAYLPVCVSVYFSANVSTLRLCLSGFHLRRSASATDVALLLIYFVISEMAEWHSLYYVAYIALQISVNMMFPTYIIENNRTHQQRRQKKSWTSIGWPMRHGLFQANPLIKSVTFATSTYRVINRVPHSRRQLTFNPIPSMNWPANGQMSIRKSIMTNTNPNVTYEYVYILYELWYYIVVYCKISTYVSNVVEAIPCGHLVGNVIVYAAMEAHQKRICEYIVCGWGNQTGQSQNAEPRQ